MGTIDGRVHNFKLLAVKTYSGSVEYYEQFESPFVTLEGVIYMLMIATMPLTAG